jgi:acetyl-CoA carboxylase carboxyl transferase subunit alpha
MHHPAPRGALKGRAVVSHGLDFEEPITEAERMTEKRKTAHDQSPGIGSGRAALDVKGRNGKRQVNSTLTPWQTVQIARHPQRPVLQDYIRMICSEFIELHGDRAFGDDQALIGGLATIGRHRVALIGHNKGKTVQENVDRNFAQARPEGYRKALRIMRLAEKFGLPVVSFVDTQGASPGLDAEERGQAEAIARNLTEMAGLRTPIIALITGEGGSGGALGIAVADVVLMMSHSIYSVISPEGCASILWRDATFSAAAAEALKLTAPSLVKLGVVDEIVEEPEGGAHRDHEATAVAIKETLAKHLKNLSALPIEKLLNKRFQKFSSMGKFAR